MPDIDRSQQIPEEALDGEVLGAGAPDCVELVPVAQSVRWAPKPAMVRSDPNFVAQLIATETQAPQTRSLRRGSPADARTAYGASRNRPYGVGFRTRQTA